jgi:hypothetical protein
MTVSGTARESIPGGLRRKHPVFDAAGNSHEPDAPSALARLMEGFRRRRGSRSEIFERLNVRRA